uniref:Btb poz domain containing protein n=1 Tax=Tetraselmis sp. GSL018 TaxID=582737 RepID=A0A061RIZ3_9CHLO
MAKGTPGKIYVHPGPTWAPKSYVWDDPDWLPASDLEEAHKAVPASFLLQAVDFWGCPRTTGGDEWEVRIDGRFSQEGSTTDYRNGTYLVTYVGHIVGHTNMSVTLNGRHANTDTEADPHAVCSWSLASDPNGSPWCVDIRPGQGSLEFDGVNYVSVPHDDRLSFGEHWSLDVWVHPRDRTDAAGRIISKQSARSGQGHWIGFVDGGNIEVGLYVGGDDFRTLRTGYEVQPGHWTHIAVAYTGDSIRVYINGGLSESKTFDRSTPIRDNNQPMVIGRGFVGLIDELRVFREDMTSQLESQLWKCPAFPELLAAYFSFNDGPGATEAHDYFGLRGALMGFNASGNRTVPDPHFFPAWRDIHAKSNYGVVDFEASRSKSFTETGFTEAVAGLDSTFTFKFWDMCGFEYVSENVEVEAMMVEDVYRNDRHDQISYPIENLTVVRQLSTTTKTAACYRSSEFRVDYTPPTCGTLRISIRLDGNMVPGFPTEIPVAPQRVPNATMSSITGVNDAVAGLETSFSIIARDRFGCQRSSGGDEFEVLMTRTTLGQNPEGIVFAGPDVVTLELSPQDQGDGTYTVPYTAPAEGNYTFYVGLVEPDDTRSYLQGEDRQPVRFVAAPPPWREVQVDGSIPDPRYRATAAKSDKYAFVFRGWSTDKEGLMDVWRYPLANQENWVYRTTVTVHNLPSHAVRIDVDTRLLIAQGKMRDDCGDVMFKAQSASEWEDPSIPYWIDPYYRCDTPSTAFWLAPPSADLYMFYGNPRARMPQEDPSRLFVVWEDFNSIDRSTELPTGWQFEGTCSLRPGDPSTFSVGHEAIRPWHGEAALQVDAISRLGGALYRKLEVPPLDQYTLRAAFYDSDAPASSHWISPNYDDCRNVPNAKEMLNQKSGLGVFTASIEEEYTALYPWRSVEDNRTAGWHLLEITSDGEHVHLYIDDVLHMTQPALAPMDRIFIRGGGQDPDVPLESLAAWDAILVARRDNATSVSFGKEEALIYTSKRFHQVSTRGTPPPPRTAAAAAVYDNKVYLLGGYGTYGTYADSGASRGATSRPEADNLVWTFDLTSETFRWMMPWGTARPSPRFEHAVAVQEETATIYFFGGRSADKGVLLSDLWAFYIGDDAWEEIQADCGPSPRFLTASVVYKHLFIVFGGLVNSDHQPGRELVSQPTNELWAFDTVERKWSDMTPKRSPAPRYAHAATMQNGQMYIYGGYDNRHHFADVHKYDIDYNRWTMLKPDTRYDTPAEKTSLAAIAHDDKLMIFGGLEETPASYTNDMWTICIY